MNTKMQVSEICATMRLENMPLPKSTKAVVADIVAGKIPKRSAMDMVIRKHMSSVNGDAQC